MKLCDHGLLSLFGLILDLRRFDLLPGQELPNASSVVLVSQSVQEDVDGGTGLSQDGGHLWRGQQREFRRYALASAVNVLDAPHHPELGRDQVGVLHGGVKGQDSVGPPAQQHGFQRSVGVELQRRVNGENGGGAESGVSNQRSAADGKETSAKVSVFIPRGMSQARDQVPGRKITPRARASRLWGRLL